MKSRKTRVHYVYLVKEAGKKLTTRIKNCAGCQQRSKRMRKIYKKLKHS